MLARRGVRSVVRVGVSSTPLEFQAHAWVEVGGRILIGGASENFVPLLTLKESS